MIKFHINFCHPRGARQSAQTSGIQKREQQSCSPMDSSCISFATQNRWNDRSLK